MLYIYNIYSALLVGYTFLGTFISFYKLLS